MINTVIRRIRARPTLTRGSKSYSDSTMETAISDNQSIPSTSARNDNKAIDSCDEEDGCCDEGYDSSTHQRRRQEQDHQQALGGTAPPSTPSTRSRRSVLDGKATSSNVYKKKSTVSFACDYGDKKPHEVIELEHNNSCQDEPESCFYSTAELNSFDRDRALTVLMYKTRNKSIPWDDSIHSIRGLEEYTVSGSSPTSNNNSNNDAMSNNNSSQCTSTRRARKELIQSVLAEQKRLRDSPEGREDLRLACKGYGMTEKELYDELIRGVSCSLSKLDKQRAIQVANADEREVNVYYKNSNINQTPTSRRRYLNMMKGNYWANTSNKSVHSTGTCSSTGTPDPTLTPIPRTSSGSSCTATPIGRIRRVCFESPNIHNDSDNDADNDDDDDDDLSHSNILPSNWRQQLASPLSLIQQVVSDTSKVTISNNKYQGNAKKMT